MGRWGSGVGLHFWVDVPEAGEWQHSFLLFFGQAEAGCTPRPAFRPATWACSSTRPAQGALHPDRPWLSQGGASSGLYMNIKNYNVGFRGGARGSRKE
jgi:hypothetical protein